MTAPGFTRAVSEQVGPYQLLAPLGRGGFSEVWEARDTRVVEPQGRRAGDPPAVVALKLLVHPEHVAQLRAEAEALTLARGEGIVRVLACDLQSDPPYLALDLCEGGDLRRRMRSLGADRDPVGTVALFEEVLTVLARVHEEGIVHGDLKPENVLFGAEGPLLADFGLSRRVSQRSASLSVSLSREDARMAGTLEYMAPEQRNGEKPTPRSDVFAAGVVLYELLVGERPQGVFALPSERDARCPPVIDRLIACSLADDPRHRFASAGAMLQFLRAGLKSDWRELATAHRGLELVLRGLRSQDVWVCLAMLAALAVMALFVFWIAASGPGAGAPGALLAALTAILAGVGSAALVLARPWLARREERLAKLMAKIEQQIAAAPGWHRSGPGAGVAPGARRSRAVRR